MLDITIEDDFLGTEEWTRFNNMWTPRADMNTFWMDLDSPLDSIQHQLTKLIWTYWNPEHVHTAVGYEYWTHTLRPSEKPLDWHRDKDEGVFHTSGEYIFPLMGSILYGEHKNLVGGSLQVKNGTRIETIEPKPNRLLIFDTSVLHKVSPIRSGERRSFATNLWHKKIKDVRFVYNDADTFTVIEYHGRD